MDLPAEAPSYQMDGQVLKHSFLTWREQLGYSFEIENYHHIVSFLTDSYELTTNPLNPYQWKHTISKGHDKTLCTYGCCFYIEEKYVSVRQYPSWIKRHYIPRFERCREGYKIVLVNDTSKFNDKCIQTLSRHNIMLMDIHQFTDFLYMIRCFYRSTKNLYKNLYKLSLNQDKSCSNQCSHTYKISYVLSTCNEIINFQDSEGINNTETASALDQETNHSIDLTTKEGRNIVQVFKEEIEIRERKSIPDEFLSYHLERMREIWKEIEKREKLDWKGIRYKYYTKRGYFPKWFYYHKYLIIKPSKTIFCSTRCYKLEKCKKIKILGYYRWLVGELIKRGLLPKPHDDDSRAYYYDLKVRKRDYDSYNLEMKRELETVMSKISFWLSFKIPKCIYVMENKVLPAIEEKKRKRRKKRRSRSKVNGELDKWIRGNKS